MKNIRRWLVVLLCSVAFVGGSRTQADERSLYYYDDQSLKELAKNGSKLVFFSTGWSGSAMGKMYKSKNRVKQARGFSVAYSLALRMYHLGLNGKVFYLTTRPSSEAQRRYLFNLHATVSGKNKPSPTSLIRVSSQDHEFAEFEKSYFEQVTFTVKNLKRNLPAHDPRRYFYLLRGKNQRTKLALKAKIERLRDEGAYFAGMEYHFGGPFFQAFKTAMGLKDMRLLGSEIYDQLGDEDPGAMGPSVASTIWENVELCAEGGEREQFDSKIPKDLGTKGQCRRLYKDIGVPHARGSYYPVRDVPSLVAEIYEFFKANRDVVNIVVKLERSSAGDGNRTYRFKEIFEKHPTFWEDETLAHAVIEEELVKQFSEAYVRRIRDHGAVFEAFIQGERFKSPAVLGMIMPDMPGLPGNVEVYFDYNQLLGGPSGQTYMGSFGPASNQKMADFGSNKEGINEVDLIAPSRKILEGLRECGAMGAVGIDFVTCDECQPDGTKERKCYAIENNVRHTGTMYPYRTFFYLAGREVMEKRYFTSTDSVKVEGLSPAALRTVRKWFYGDFMENNPFRYDPLTQSGCLVYLDTWALKKVGIACVAETEASLRKVFQGFSDSITKEVASYVKNPR